MGPGGCWAGRGASACSLIPASCGPSLAAAPALDCHVCAYNGENCFNPMRCPAMVSYCMTTRTCEFLGCSPSPLWGAPGQGWG